MVDLNDQLRRMTQDEARRLHEPKARAGVPLLRYVRGDLQLNDQTLAPEEPETLAWLETLIPGLKVSVPGTPKPVVLPRLPAHLQAEVDRLRPPLDSQFMAWDGPRVLSEDEQVAAGIRFLRSLDDGAGDGGQQSSGEAQLTADERQIIAWMKSLGGGHDGGAA